MVTWVRIACVAAASLGSALCLGQEAAQPAPDKAPAPVVPQRTGPQYTLGKRVEQTRLAASVCSTVVIVRDAESYVKAIVAWRPERRFPVLIDDGSWTCREDIARFVRAFKPKSVVRWRAPGAAEAEPGMPFPRADRAAVFAALCAAWNLPEGKADAVSLLEVWKAAAYKPPGLVVADDADRAWPAALALAAGRGQVLVFVTVRQGVNDDMRPEEAEVLEDAAEAAATASGLTWRGLGDDLECVTLCLNVPPRIVRDTKTLLAVTDKVGRLGKGFETRERWAWCGQVFGTPAETAYRAMCSLFLEFDSAFIFDGYPNSAPWNDYSGGVAAKVLREAGIAVEVHSEPRNGAADWRGRAARVVDAGLILLNTKGYVDYFELGTGQCKSGDVPFLTRPVAAHVVHSWSAIAPAARHTVGGRWMERGVFVYAGSVQEPFLNAFMPTPAVAARLLMGAPFGAAIRLDSSPPWKINVLGDPLYTYGPAALRVEEAPTLEGATDVAAGLRDALTADKYEE